MGGAARCLDLSRLVSRVGRGAFTGIDRVEAAYLTRLLHEPGELFGLVRSSFGFTLFDRAGMEALAARLLGEVPWGPPDVISRLFLKQATDRRGVEADLRRLAIARTGRRFLPQTFARYFPKGITYINVGHSNLRVAVFDALRDVEGRAVVMIHDTIPLDHPEWQREGTVESFEQRLHLVARRADLVIHTAQATRALTEAHFGKAGRVPEGITAHLGIDVPEVDPEALPPEFRQDRDYYLVLGTIEPRKNHALLLDLWEALAQRLPKDQMPRLLILGARGWNNDAVFARLDRLPGYVRELGALPDGALGAVIQGARALLMPSHVEGFGLPLGEALALGTPVIATDLPVYREVYGNNIIYLDSSDLYSWVEKLAKTDTDQDRAPAVVPKWENHFNLVLKSL